MTKDIIENQLLIGLTKSEVIELLGKDFTIPYKRSMAYITYKPQIMFSLDHSVLMIYFDDKGVVTNVSDYAL